MKAGNIQIVDAAPGSYFNDRNLYKAVIYVDIEEKYMEATIDGYRTILLQVVNFTRMEESVLEQINTDRAAHDLGPVTQASIFYTYWS